MLTYDPLLNGLCVLVIESKGNAQRFISEDNMKEHADAFTS